MTKKIALAAMKQNYFSPEKKDFANVVVAARKKGISDAKITSVALETIQKNRSPKDMASHFGLKAEDLAHGPVMGTERHPGTRRHDMSKPGYGGAESHSRAVPNMKVTVVQRVATETAARVAIMAEEEATTAAMAVV